MSRICPHCNYARRSTDQVPDWQCPSCEKAYVKAGNPVPLDSFRRSGPVTTGRRGMAKWLMLLLAFGVAFWFGRPLLQQRSVPAEALATSQPEVLLYATDWCGYCKATRQFFAENGIQYTEYDIEKSSVALSEHRKRGGNGVPLVVIGDDVIKGYNEGAMRQLLKPWFKS